MLINIRLILAILFSLLVVSCANTEQKEQPSADPVQVEQTVVDQGSEVVGDAITTEEYVVLFDFDSYVIKNAYLPMLENQASQLDNLSSDKFNILIEGHTDERGTAEYNVALGEKRANAVLDLFKTLGVSSESIRTVSYGEEQPVDDAHNEAAWSKNRRAVIRLEKSN